MKGHIAESATLVNDREKAYGALVLELGLDDEPHKVDMRDPVHLEAMALVYNPCSRVKRCLWRFTSRGRTR